jgi:hypothetical protein
MPGRFSKKLIEKELQDFFQSVGYSLDKKDLVKEL